MRFVSGFVLGVLATGLLTSRGVDLSERLGHLVNGSEVRQLIKDVGHAVKSP